MADCLPAGPFPSTLGVTLLSSGTIPGYMPVTLSAADMLVHLWCLLGWASCHFHIFFRAVSRLTGFDIALFLQICNPWG